MMPKNSKGLGIDRTQPFKNHTQIHVTSKKLSTRLSNERQRRFDRDMLPNPREYYAGELHKFHPQGEQATALCPFHPDKNHSFSVDLRRGKFFCFSCFASGGKILDFHMRLHGVNFIKAVADLGAWSYE